MNMRLMGSTSAAEPLLGGAADTDRKRATHNATGREEGNMMGGRKGEGDRNLNFVRRDPQGGAVGCGNITNSF